MDHRGQLSPQKERELIRVLQREFPVVKRPFREVANRLDMDEDLLIEVLKNWEREGKLRQISAIFNPQALGHRSSLFAFRVAEESLEKAVEIINSHPGVSHNYLRNHDYNLWFTLVVPPGRDLLEEAEELLRQSGAVDMLYLPTLKVFKISATFDLENGEMAIDNSQEVYPKDPPRILTEEDIRMIRALQEPLPLVREPFRDLAERLHMEEDRIFSWLREMERNGCLRRFGALFKHQKLGFTENYMVVWRVSEERLEEVGKLLSKKTFITHCYLRKSYPNWPYNIYTMCHFRDEGVRTIQKLSDEIAVKDFLILRTEKEFKKVRLKLFYS